MRSALHQDLRSAVRSLRKHWGFALLATASLTLGLGSNTALFSLVDALLLRPLPVPQPERLVLIQRVTANGKKMAIDAAALDVIRGLDSVFVDAALTSAVPAPNLSIDGAPEPARVVHTSSATFFPTLGLQPQAGRLTFTEPAAVISDRYWQIRFDRDATAVGLTVTVNGASYPIVGVAPPEFLGVSLDGAVDIWLLQPRGRVSAASAIARLKNGVPRAYAEAAVSAALDRADRERSGETDAHVATTVIPGGQGTSTLRERYRAPLIALMGLVALVLLMTCANVANLLVVRNLDRAHEFRVRTALGASRSRLIAQLLVESLVLSLAGGIGAWFVAKWGVSLLLSTLPSAEAAARLELTADPRVMAFMAVATLTATLVCALAPAWKATRVDAASALRTTPSQAGPAGAQRLALAIVGGQVALSAVLIAGAVLFVQTARNAASIPLGFERSRLVEVELADRVLRAGAADVRRMHETMLANIRAIPGVESVALSMPLFPAWAMGVEQPAGESGFRVSPEYFSVMRIPLLRGRLLTTSDLTRADPVVVANQWYAEQWFPGEDAIGKHGGFNDAEIVGIVGNATTDNVRWRMPVLYRPVRPDEARFVPAIAVRVAASVDPQSVFRPLEAAVRQAHPRLFVAVRTADQALARSIGRERMVATTSALFGAIGIALAGLGIFGIAASAVARRTSELGLRLALGASRRRVVRDALGGTAVVFCAGLAAGLAAAVAAARALDSALSALLIGLRAGDWMVVAAAACGLLVVALMAGIVPALRAARLDPLVAIRGE